MHLLFEQDGGIKSSSLL